MNPDSYHLLRVFIAGSAYFSLVLSLGVMIWVHRQHPMTLRTLGHRPLARFLLAGVILQNYVFLAVKAYFAYSYTVQLSFEVPRMTLSPWVVVSVLFEYPIIFLSLLVPTALLFYAVRAAQRIDAEEAVRKKAAGGGARGAEERMDRLEAKQDKADAKQDLDLVISKRSEESLKRVEKRQKEDAAGRAEDEDA